MSFFNKIVLIAFLISVIYVEKQAEAANICAIFCYNRGDCEFYKNDLICHCNTGYKGNCSLTMQSGDDICLSSPCWNGGICKSINNNADFQCTCPSGTTGKDCRIVTLAACDKSPCMNNGKCQAVTINGVQNAICFCPSNFTGTYCETFLPCTDTIPCSNNGTCINNQCICAQNWTGITCDVFRVYNTPKIVKIKNLGWYIGDATITYQVFNGDVATDQQQKGAVLSYQDYTFRIPYNADYKRGKVARLIVNAVAGVQVMNYVLDNDPICFHIWGVSLIAKWSVMPCW